MASLAKPTVILELVDPQDLASLTEMAQAFHTEDGHPLSPTGERALSNLVGSTFGEALWITAAQERVGYVLLCFGFSIEYGGRDAFIDDLYVAPSARGRGLGTEVLESLAGRARAAGCHALHLEVLDGNPAINLYDRMGFSGRGSRFLTRRL